MRPGADKEAGEGLLPHLHGQEQTWTFERRGCEGESKAKEETREQEEEQQRKGACEQIREEGEEGDDDQDGGVEQPRLEDGSASAQSSSCKGILVNCVPHVF